MNIGVALGGGGVRGLAHILALEVIDELGLRPAAISGTSMGAIIGALYASGMSGNEIRERVNQHIITKDDSVATIYQKKGNLFKWLKVVRPSVTGSGLLKADGLMRLLLESLQTETFEDLEIPFKVLATDYTLGESVVFTEGPLLPAIRASMSIPGVFVPVELEGRILVDGGLTDQVPYDVLLEECDITVAIDVGPTRENTFSKPPSALEATLGMFDIVVDQVVAAQLRECPPSIYIRPVLTGVKVLEFDKIEEVYTQAAPAMDELRTALKELIKKEEGNR
jgi:NTE family protein